VRILRDVHDELIVSEDVDSHGRRVVLTARVWWEKIILHHVEVEPYLRHVMPAVAHPDRAECDPAFEGRTAATRATSVPVAGFSSS
jgi:hypothetical protein